ncbi:MAG: branched chain amino acid ABC transporter substrate-binding protein [Candidatus Methylomirabilota bacterium]|nr:MAG: branched chain amino acid ABC transporter substrate-binding protein [candidate division NC10 bacterium]
MGRGWLRVVCNALALLLLVTTNAYAAGTLKVGVAGPLTGDQGALGQELKNGVTIAVEEWNAKGGLLGRRIEIVWGDDQHDPKQAVAVANKFVNEEVVGVVGHFNSSCSIPASNIYRDGGVVQLTPASTNPRFTERGLWNVFRVCGRDDQQGGAAANFIVKKLKKTKVAVLHDKTTYGQGLADETVKALEKAGIKPVYYGNITQGEKDYRPVLTSIKQTNPEVLFYGGIYPEAILLTKQMRELGMKTAFISGDGVWAKEFVEIAGKAAEGAFITFTPDQTRIKEAQGVIQQHKAKFGTAVGAYTVYSYVAAVLLFEAIAATQSTDGAKIAEHIRKTKWKTALGPIQFDHKGDVLVSPYVVWEVKNGRFVELQ